MITRSTPGVLKLVQKRGGALRGAQRSRTNARHVAAASSAAPSLDQRHREVELEPLRLARQRRAGSDETAPCPSAPVCSRTRAAAARNARDRASGPPCASSSAERRDHLRAPRRFRANRRISASARVRASSRTGTAAAPAPGRGDRPTRPPSARPQSRNSEPSADRSASEHPALPARETAAHSSASRSGDRRPSDSAGSPTRASPDRTRRRSGRRPRCGSAAPARRAAAAPRLSPGDQPISAR